MTILSAATRDGSTLARNRSVSRAVAVLRAFTPEEPLLPLAAIAARAGLDPGTTRRLLVTLRDEGLVRQDAGTGRYCLTLELAALASAVPEGASLRALAEARLMRLAQDTRATIFLSVLRDGKAMCLARHHGAAPVEVRWWAVGGTLPLNCGAAPKLLLAFAPHDQREAVLNGRLQALTPHSTTDAARLRDELAAIRERGWAAARDDVAEGLSALAVPLRSVGDRLVAAISAGGLTPQILGEGEGRCLAGLKDCQADLEARLARLPQIAS